MTTKKDLTIKKTGELLLNGWKMLQLICPLCSSPLMEKGKECCCPSCNLPILRNNEISPFNSPPENKEELKEIKKFQSLEEVKKEYDKNQIKQKLISSKIGEKLLIGWTLLAKECEICQTPLMSFKGGPLYCALCDTMKTIESEKKGNNKLENKSEEKKIENKNKIEVESIELSKAAELLANIPILEAEYNDENITSLEGEDPSELIEEASQLIGEKLLLGWTLLDESCEDACQGNVPLMKDPVKKQVLIFLFIFKILNFFEIIYFMLI